MYVRVTVEVWQKGTEATTLTAAYRRYQSTTPAAPQENQP